MKKIVALMAVVISLSLTGCAARTMISQADFSVNNKPMTASTVTVRDRTGTELHHVMVHDQTDKLVSTATAQGRGIVAGMTDGALPAALQAAGMVGAVAVWPADNYNTTNSSDGGVSTSDASATGGAGGLGGAGGAGGAASATASPKVTATGGTATANLKNSVKNVNHNVNQNHNNNKNKGGWTPPGQDKK